MHDDATVMLRNVAKMNTKLVYSGTGSVNHGFTLVNACSQKHSVGNVENKLAPQAKIVLVLPE